MKKQLLKIGAACLALTVSASVMGQFEQAEAVVKNLGSGTIVIDGVLDDAAWGAAEEIAIDQPFKEEVPTGDFMWQAAWNDDGIYVAVTGDDDVWMPSWLSGAADWESDKVEVYLDMTDPQQDGGGASAGLGNYQIGQNFSETDMGTEMPYTGSTFGDVVGVITADTYDTDGGYIMEFYMPWSTIPNNAGDAIDPWVTTLIGFDVTICDRDAAADGMRNRACWSNIGDADAGNDESWNNLDDAGLITLSSDELGTSIKSRTSNVNVLASTVVSDELVVNVNYTEIKVLNSIGQVVKSDVNVSDLNNGVYIAVIKTNDGEVFANRFIKK